MNFLSLDFNAKPKLELMGEKIIKKIKGVVWPDIADLAGVVHSLLHIQVSNQPI